MDTVAIAQRHGDAGGRARLAGLQRAEELRRVDSRRTTGSCRSTPTSGSRRSSRPRFAPCMDASRRPRGYRIPRVTWYLGRWIRSTDWYPDYQLRLYDRRAGELERPAGCTSRSSCSGTPGAAAARAAALRLPRHLAPSRHNRSLHDAGGGAVDGRGAAHRRWSRLRSTPTFAFLRNYVLRRGFIDGSAGLLVSILNSYYVFLKFAKLWELQRVARSNRDRRRGRIGHAGPAASPDPRACPRRQRQASA